MFTSPLSASPYEVLGVSPSADEDALRRAYRLRLRQTHPDTGGDAAEFVRVQQAWEILGTAEGRAAYAGGHEVSYARGAAPRRAGTRLGSTVLGTAGALRRERYEALAAELAGGADVYAERFVRAAPWELRALLADALAEEATAELIDALGMGFTVWHGFAVGDGDVLDHVVLGPSGLYALASEDFGAPVRFRQGEPIAAGSDGRTPIADLQRRMRLLARAARVRFGGAILILPDDDLADAAVALGDVRGAPTVAVRRSALSTLLRRGAPGARAVRGNEVFDVRARLSRAFGAGGRG